MRVLLITLICLSFLSLERCQAEVRDAASHSSNRRQATFCNDADNNASLELMAGNNYGGPRFRFSSAPKIYLKAI